MADIDLKTETPDTTLPATGFLFGADSQASASPSVYSTQAVATTLLGSTTLSGTTITADAPVLNLTQTWNNAAVTFTGAKLNITGADAGSAAGSLLMDLQVGGASRFYVGKTGRANIFDLNCWDGDLLIYRAGTAAARVGTSSFGAPSQISLSNNNPSAPDLYVSRRGAANLRLGAADTTGTTAPTPQFLSAQSWASSTNNNQTGANFTIDGSQGTGTGAGGSIIFRVAPAGVTANGVQNALATALTIGADRNLTMWGNGAAFYFESASGFEYSGSGTIAVRSAGARMAAFKVTGSGQVCFSAGAVVGFTSGAAESTSLDTILARDTANTLALRNGTAAQTFNVYNTFTDASNYERLASSWVSNVMQLTTQAAGTGTLRAMEINAGSYINFNIGGSNRFGVGGATNTSYVPLNVSASQYIQFSEGSAATGSANTARIYCEDNGSGKTRLMVIFGSGAAQQIAIEP